MNSPGKVIRIFVFGCLGAVLGAFAVPSQGQSGKDSGVVFGGSAYYPPFEWLDETGRPKGFLVDLENTIAESGGRRSVQRLSTWPESLIALDAGRVDVVPMFYSEERARKYLFTEPFYYVMHAIYGPPGTTGVTGPESLNGKRVAVVSEGYAESKIGGFASEAQLVPNQNIESSLLSVAEGAADLALVARPTATRFIQDRGFELQAVGPPFWPRRYVFAVSRDRPELLAWVERNFRTVVAEGRYHDIYATWKDELEWSRPRTADYLRRAGVILIPVLFLAVLGYIWSWQLHRRVAAATRELEFELGRRESAEKELRYRVRHDALTDLPTRNEFVRRCESVLMNPQEGQVLVATVRLVDLDQIISAFGYETGEQLLEKFGARLRQMGFAAAGDFGRGVFGVLIAGEMEPQWVLRELTAPVDLGRIELDPHFTMGIVRYPDQGKTVEELVRKAETALADAASRNRPWVEYAESMEPDPEDLIIVRDFRRLGSESIYPVYQPMIDLTSMRMVGAEALVRWQHPEFGLVCPERFIPLLESAGVVYRVTRYMIREAAHLGRELNVQGLAIPISVNVSAIDLLEGDLSRLIEEALTEFDLDPEMLRLEMTETSVIEDPERVGQVVSDLGRKGVRCGIDDFGVGYSSLSYLSEFIVNEVKIDRSFVAGMRHDESHRTIVRSIIALAHKLNLDVVAEGVEDWETVESLRREGCDRAQGFVFSRPVFAADLADLAVRDFGAGAASIRR